MNQKPDMGGLASLLASRGRNGDSVLVHMTPEEVGGLQALAMAHGGSLSVNPDTKLPEANFLKAILPAIAGSTLKTLFPKLGSATTGLIVGAATGLIDKSFDKGLRSGLSAYSGAKTMEGLSAARKAVQAGSVVPRITTERGEELSAKRLMDKAPIDVSKLVVEVPQVQTVTKAPSLFGEMGQGIRALFKPEGQEAFLEAVEGPYKRQGLKDLSRSAYFAGLANLAAKEPKKIKPGTGSSATRFYIPGEVNPLYGQGYNQPYFLPGTYSNTYPGYADGGEVMVSPQAVLPQQVTVSKPQFTQDREGLRNYYESLLVPPDTTPRDTSELKAYLDELNARLRRPYKPGSDYEYAPTTTPVTPPPIIDPDRPISVAPPLPNTPIVPQPTPPKSPKDEVKEDLTPPDNIARVAVPSDLRDLYVSPTPINMPEPTVSVIPLEQEIIPEVLPEEMYQPDINQVLRSIPEPTYIQTEPEQETEVSVIPLEQEIIPEVLPEEMYQPDINEVLRSILEPTYIQTEPEQETEVTVTPIEDLIVPEVLPEEMYQPDINEVLRSILEPTYIQTEPEQEAEVTVTPIEDLIAPEVRFEDMVSTDSLNNLFTVPTTISSPVGKVTVEEVPDVAPPQSERDVADALRQQLFRDMGGFGEPGFVQAQTTQQVADASQPIVDEILKNFEEQQKTEKKETVEKAKEIGMGIAEQALRSAFPMAGLIYDIYKEVTAKEEPKGEVTVEEVKEGEEGEKTEEKERADIAYTPSKGSGATFMNIGLGAERAALAKAAAAGTEDEGPEYSVGVEEIGGMAAGGPVPRFAGGGGIQEIFNRYANTRRPLTDYLPGSGTAYAARKIPDLIAKTMTLMNIPPPPSAPTGFEKYFPDAGKGGRNLGKIGDITSEGWGVENAPGIYGDDPEQDELDRQYEEMLAARRVGRGLDRRGGGVGLTGLGAQRGLAGAQGGGLDKKPTITIEEIPEPQGYAGGGLSSLQQYAVGGKLVNGAGDGMSDDIKANISGVQEARLADGEFVIPADVVSHLGNGSTDAGAKQLYAMMDRIRKARTGRTRQAPEVKARKYMPA